MRTFILVCFWLQAFSLSVNIIRMITSDYPRIDTRSLGFDTASCIVAVIFGLWAAMILWIAP